MDTSGAVLAGAAVQVKNTATGIAQYTSSDAQGRFRVPELIIGDYEVQASKVEFLTEVRTGVPVAVGSRRDVDFHLPVGQQNQTITVSGDVSQVETQSIAVGTLVESKQISDLPLNGRNFTQLLTLAPGVIQIPFSAPGGGGTLYGNGQKYSITGSRPSGQSYLLDGQDITGFWNNGPGASGLGTALGVEAIAEFQTLTQTYSTQFGGNGAVINAASKPGTNRFHGSVYEFLRNDKLEVRNIFDGSKRPAYRQNQFGGSIGGPIKRDKIFFFANYEGLRLHREVTAQITVPNQCSHQFLASTLTPGVCGAPVTQNSNPVVRQAIQNTMALYPNTAINVLTTGLGATLAPSGTGSAFVVNPTTGQQNYLLTRLDYTVSEKSAISFRYVTDRAERTFASGAPYWPEIATTKSHFLSFTERHVLSPRLVNVFTASFARPNEAAAPVGSPIVANGVATPAKASDPGLHPLQFFGPASGRPDGNILSFSGVVLLGSTRALPYYLIPNRFVVADDLSWTLGAHSLKAGISITRMRENTFSTLQIGAQFTFGSLGAFMAGNPASVVGQFSDEQNPLYDSTRDYRYWLFAPYIDDQWKVTSRLSVTLGLRYSPATIIQVVRHQNFQLLNMPFGVWTPKTDLTEVNPSLKNWDPRVGLVWDPFGDHRTSIRSGFGIFHSTVFPRDMNNWLQPPYLKGQQDPNSNPPLQYLGTCATSCSPFTIPITPGEIPLNGSLAPTANDYYLKNTPYQLQWNFNIQHEIMRDTVATAGYAGSHGVHSFLQNDTNHPVGCTGPNRGCFYNGRPTYGNLQGVAIRPNPQFASVVAGQTIASSRYHSFQSSLNRRFSNNWQMQVSYTFSKSTDNGSGTYAFDGGGITTDGTNPDCISCDAALSNFNRAHNFRASGIYSVRFRAKGFAGALINGWQITGVFTYLSGAPFSPIGETNRVYGGNNGAVTGRPDLVAGCDLYTGFRTIDRWFNPACFAAQPQGTYGNAGRNIIIGPNLWNMDNSLIKNWKVSKVSEDFALQFRAEVFNTLNHPSLQPFSPNVGQIFTTTGLNAAVGRITQTSSAPRIFQLALKIRF
jgi:hypothetical protein